MSIAPFHARRQGMVVNSSGYHSRGKVLFEQFQRSPPARGATRTGKKVREDKFNQTLIEITKYSVD